MGLKDRANKYNMHHTVDLSFVTEKNKAHIYVAIQIQLQLRMPWNNFNYFLLGNHTDPYIENDLTFHQDGTPPYCTSAVVQYLIGRICRASHKVTKFKSTQPASSGDLLINSDNYNTDDFQ